MWNGQCLADRAASVTMLRPIGVLHPVVYRKEWAVQDSNL